LVLAYPSLNNRCRISIDLLRSRGLAYPVGTRTNVTPSFV